MLGRVVVVAGSVAGCREHHREFRRSADVCEDREETFAGFLGEPPLLQPFRDDAERIRRRVGLEEELEALGRGLEVEPARGKLGSPVRFECVDRFHQGLIHKAVDRLIYGLQRGLQRAHTRDGTGRDDALKPHARMGILGCLADQLHRIRQSILPTPDHRGGIRPSPEILRSHERSQERRHHEILRLQNAERLYEVPFIERIGDVELVDPELEGVGQEGGRLLGQHALGLDAIPAFPRLQLVEQLGQPELVEDDARRRRPALGRHAPDPAADLVAARITERRLVVADDGVEPVGDVERAVGAGADVHRAEARVRRRDQRRQRGQLEARAIVLGTEHHDGVVHEPIRHDAALERIRHRLGADDLDAAEFLALRPDALMVELVVRHDQGRCEVVDAVPVAGEEERSTPIVEGETPGIVRRHAVAEEGIEPELVWAQPPHAGFVELHEAVGSFHPRHRVQALAEEQFAARAPRERVDRLVRVAGAEAAQDDLPLVGLPVAVGVDEVQQLVGVADKKPAVEELDARRDQESVGEDGRLVRAAVAVGVLQNDDLVVRFLAGFQLGIDRAGRDIRPAAWIEPDLDRFRHAVEFGGEEVDLETVGDLEGRELRGRIVRVGFRGEGGDGNDGQQAAKQGEFFHRSSGMVFASSPIMASACSINGPNCSSSPGNQRTFGSR